MKKLPELTTGQKLTYHGNNKDIDKNEYGLIFLGYDAEGWDGIWVDHRGEKLFLNIRDVDAAL
jgi:hypothetical protein